MLVGCRPHMVVEEVVVVVVQIRELVVLAGFPTGYQVVSLVVIPVVIGGTGGFNGGAGGVTV